MWVGLYFRELTGLQCETALGAGAAGEAGTLRAVLGMSSDSERDDGGVTGNREEVQLQRCLRQRAVFVIVGGDDEGDYQE